MSIMEEFIKAGQGHLFEQLDQLPVEDQKHFMENLKSVSARISPKKLVHDCKEALKLAAANSKTDICIEPLPESSYESIIDNEKARAKYGDLGREAIRRGEVAVILMAGGQGTRLGSLKPKGCYDIGLPSGKSLFQIQGEKILRLQELTGAQKPIPWYIMTSEPTRKNTEEFFVEKEYFGLSPKQVTFFNQGTLPAFDLKGEELLMSSPTALVQSPDGNGGLYRALKDNCIVDDFVAKGIKHVYMYCVDNVLSKVADPVFLGFAIENGFDLATKAVRKRDFSESVGLIATKDGKPCVIEYSEISPELAQGQNKDGLLNLRAGNIVNHYYSVDLLKRELYDWCNNMPFHIAKKKISFYDNKTGETYKPTEPNGIKLEQFIFDVFPSVPLEKFGCLEVDRTEEFSPLKNGLGSSNDNPATSREAYLTLGTSWLKNSGAKVADGVLVEVSSTLSYAGEQLSQFKDVQFNENGTFVD
ncbi:hypothetical protein HG535_0D01400 [Zygotorulaspora mrakii]|uniref:UDP-N-acetylglucosamine diphosphorylase n=1 Tax=Zygotorulaspora mrakii TaxID=42260 RepID=A0A7H9B3W8_ZYGMR|nr:uncharacterized protein HG535_0D01400 [Zygotorulaspora mrakii]QLG72432.1 hypothetical protein HG535_0D01400 [Zygotorulaspora mrakii]